MKLVLSQSSSSFNAAERTGVTSWEDSVKSSVSHFYAFDNCPDSVSGSSNSIVSKTPQTQPITSNSNPVSRKKSKKVMLQLTALQKCIINHFISFNKILDV